MSLARNIAAAIGRKWLCVWEGDMIVKDDLETLFDYGYWANRKLFEVLRQLTTVQFTQPVAGSYGSVRNTLVHTLSAE